MRSKTQMHLLLGLICVAALLSGVAPAVAETEKAPAEDWRFHSIVDVAFVQQYAKVPTNPKAMIIDSRPKRAKYDRGHIPMAVSIPDSKFDKMVDKLPLDKDAVLVYYCGGVT